jgi:hypothetical protein
MPLYDRYTPAMSEPTPPPLSIPAGRIATANQLSECRQSGYEMLKEISDIKERLAFQKFYNLLDDFSKVYVEPALDDVDPLYLEQVDRILLQIEVPRLNEYAAGDAGVSLAILMRIATDISKFARDTLDFQERVYPTIVGILSDARSAMSTLLDVPVSTCYEIEDSDIGELCDEIDAKLLIAQESVERSTESLTPDDRRVAKSHAKLIADVCTVIRQVLQSEGAQPITIEREYKVRVPLAVLDHELGDINAARPSGVSEWVPLLRALTLLTRNVLYIIADRFLPPEIDNAAFILHDVASSQYATVMRAAQWQEQELGDTRRRAEEALRRAQEAATESQEAAVHAKEAAGMSGQATLALYYDKLAAEEITSANRFRIAAFAILGVSLVLGAVFFYYLMTHNELNVGSQLTRFAGGVPLLLLGLYLVRLEVGHRMVGRRAKEYAIRLQTLAAFSEMLPEKKEELIYEIGRSILTGPPSLTSDKDKNGIDIDDLAKFTDVVQKVSGLGQAKRKDEPVVKEPPGNTAVE